MRLAPPRALALTLLTALLPACDDRDETPLPDTGPPACNRTGCPPDQICLPAGDCITPADLANAAYACITLDQCLALCPDTLCFEDCARLAGPLPVARYNALVQCVQFNDCFRPTGGIDVPCLQANCASEHTDCPLPLPATPQGTTRCGTFVQCLNTCPFDPPEAEQQCLDACVTQASPEAFDLYLTAVQCIATQCPDPDPRCQAEACGPEVDACFAHGLGTGTLPCDDVLECIFSCPDPACAERCEIDASPTAFTLWRAFVNCAAPTGCGTYDTCLTLCPAETRACENDR